MKNLGAVDPRVLSIHENYRFLDVYGTLDHKSSIRKKNCADWTDLVVFIKTGSNLSNLPKIYDIFQEKHQDI